MSTAGAFQEAWRTLPVGGLDEIIGRGTCLILAPHPDDESLGCGGLIARCVSVGRVPLVVILTDGAGSHHSPAYPPDRLRAVRAEEALTAVTALGLPPDRLEFLGEPDTAAPHSGLAFDAVVAKLVAMVRQETSCTAILAPWRHDPHCDHEAAALIAAAVADAAKIRHLAYPVWGWTLDPDAQVPGLPGSGWRLHIETVQPVKQKAIHAHRTQYGGLITDDPAGFQLPHALLAAFDSPYETFLET